MIGLVMRLSTIFANMMAAASLALAVTIGVAGTIERTSAGCYGCLHASGVSKPKPVASAAGPPSGIQIAFGTFRSERSLQ